MEVVRDLLGCVVIQHIVVAILEIIILANTYLELETVFKNKI